MPTLVPFAISSNLRQARRFAMLEDTSWIKSWLSGPILRVVFSSVLALSLCIFTLPQLAMWNLFAWFTLLASAPVFLTANRLIGARLAKHFSSPFKAVETIRAAGLLTFFLLAFVVVGVSVLLPSDNSQLWQPPGATPSAIVTDWITVAHFLEHIQSYTLAQIRDQPFWQAIVAFLLGPGSVAAFSASLATSAAMPQAEFRRVLGPATLDSPPPLVSRSTVLWTSTITTVFILFAALPLLATAEARLRSLPPELRAAGKLINAAEKVRVLVEIVNGQPVRPGTIEALRSEAKRALETFSEGQVDALRMEINKTADGMIDNVDPFLDKYYTLVSEYKRIASMLVGDLAEELAQDLSEALARGAPAANLESILESAYFSEAMFQALEKLDQISKEITSRNRVEATENTALIVTLECDSAPCIEFTTAFSEIQNDTFGRLYASGLTGSVGGLVTGLVVKKIVAKGTLKMAAQAMTKAVTAKTAAGGLGTAVGTIIGGAIGSVVPGAGTAAGAAVGGVVVGVLVGVSVDAMLLTLEEAIEREAFKAEIVGEINAWRSATLELLAPRASGISE